jgi:hypothetical protein
VSDTLEKTDEKVTTTNDGDHDKYAHYFAKWQLEANLLDGKPMTAVCGKVVEGRHVDPNGRTICPTCKEIYEGLPDTNG